MKLIKDPFCKIIQDILLKCFYYKDDKGFVQGPFTAIEMDNWF